MKYIAYVLSSTITQKSYVGSTDNLERRIEDHNKGKNTFTKRYKPWKIVYFEEFKTLEKPGKESDI